MQVRLLELLRCPACHSDLSTSSDAPGGEIHEGVLVCDGCSAEYRVTNGIPRFVSTEEHAGSFGFQWTRFRKEQVDARSGMHQSEERFLAETGWDSGWMKGKWVMEGGSGAGRFLEVASRYPCDVVGVDISSAVDACKETLKERSNVHLVQASIENLPFKDSVFEGVYCIGVIQHTPHPDRVVRELPRVLGPAGRIAITAYERKWYTMLYSKYWIRPFTRRLPNGVLLGLLRAIMPVAFLVTEILFRLPLLGRVFGFLIPIANYVNDPELDWRRRYQWAILDTFDMLAPAYDQPQRESEVTEALAETGVREIRRLPNPGLNLVGSKSA